MNFRLISHLLLTIYMCIKACMYRALKLSSSGKVTTKGSYAVAMYTLGCGVRAVLVQVELKVHHTY